MKSNTRLKKWLYIFLFHYLFEKSITSSYNYELGVEVSIIPNRALDPEQILFDS